MEVAIMIEGQNGLNWEKWKRIALAVEELGFVGLFRSDHYTNATPPDLDSLELWTSLTWLASHTSKIEFGPLVTPVSFRHPTMTARMASAVDDLSNGRLILGLGAGWQEREHENYGWDLLSIPERFERFEEGIKVITKLLKDVVPQYFDGEYYSLKDALLLPRPEREGGPPILIGGNGPKRTLPLVAKYANEWNAVYLTISEYRNRSILLDELLLQEGRPDFKVKRSLMTACVYGHNQRDLEQKVAERTGGKKKAQQLYDKDLIVGTADQIIHKLGNWADEGIYRVMLQWLNLDDMKGLVGLAKEVLPQL